MTKSQETIIKKVEELCAELFQNYKDWDKEGEKFRNKIEREGGEKPEKENEYKIEGKKITEKYLRKRSEILKEIKNQILKDLTLWELDLEGNIQPMPGLSINTHGAGGGYILFGYKPGTNYIHFFSEKPNISYKKEITCAFVEEIKQNPQDWEIITEDKRDAPFVERPMVANRSDCQVVKHKSGRRHNQGYQWYKNEKGEIEGPGFSNEEWAEIENALKNQKSDNKELTEKKRELQIEEDKNKKMIEERERKEEDSLSISGDKKDQGPIKKVVDSQQNQPQKTDNKENRHKNIYYGVGLISLVLFLVSVVGVWVKKRK